MMIRRLYNRLFKNKRSFGLIDLVEKNNISVIFDVGANVGQYATELRKLGFKGKIISFEPVSSVFEKLCKNMEGDNNWIGENYAIGGRIEQIKINVSEGTSFSSFKTIGENIKIASPEAVVTHQELVNVKPLSEVIKKYKVPNKKMMLKLDTQGFDYDILESAKECLSDFNIIQTELSLIPVYEEQPLIEKVIDFLRANGFDISFLEPVYFNHVEKKYMEYDGFFIKRF